MCLDYKNRDSRRGLIVPPHKQPLLTRVLHGLAELLMALAIFVVPLALYTLI